MLQETWGSTSISLIEEIVPKKKKFLHKHFSLRYDISVREFAGVPELGPRGRA